MSRLLSAALRSSGAAQRLAPRQHPRIMLPDAERSKLLAAPYAAPALQPGDRARCLLRGCEVIVTAWTDAPLPWPRCRAPASGAGRGLLLDGELARAVRTESAAAIQHWWGVSRGAVHRWRKALGVGQWDPEGSRRLHRAASEKGASKLRGVPLSPAQVEQRRRRAVEQDLIRHAHARRPGAWTAEEIALLGTLPDADLARLLSRTPNAIRLKRAKLNIPNSCDERIRRPAAALLA